MSVYLRCWRSKASPSIRDYKQNMSTFAQQPGAIPDGLLRTKLAPPRLPTAYVPRPSLLARIDEGLARKLTLISTPAGFGKTTLLAEWLASRSDELRVKSSELPSPKTTLNSQLVTLYSPVTW